MAATPFVQHEIICLSGIAKQNAIPRIDPRVQTSRSQTFNRYAEPDDACEPVAAVPINDNTHPLAPIPDALGSPRLKSGHRSMLRAFGQMFPWTPLCLDRPSFMSSSSESEGGACAWYCDTDDQEIVKMGPRGRSPLLPSTPRSISNIEGAAALFTASQPTEHEPVGAIERMQRFPHNHATVHWRDFRLQKAAYHSTVFGARWPIEMRNLPSINNSNPPQ